MTFCSKKFNPERCPKHPLQITTRTLRPDFKFELLPLHSPLLRQSLLVSFPPLIDMLKFSGYSYLIRGQPLEVKGGDRPAGSFLRVLVKARCAEGSHGRRHCLWDQYDRSRTAVQHQTRGLREDNDARTGMPIGIPMGAMCVQRFDDSRKFCNSHYLSHFAAFFIDARTKRSVVESFNLFNNLIQTTGLGQEFWLWPSADALQTSKGPASRGRDGHAEATRGNIDTGLGGRALRGDPNSVMILPQVHLRKPCYDFYFL